MKSINSSIIDMMISHSCLIFGWFNLPVATNLLVKLKYINLDAFGGRCRKIEFVYTRKLYWFSLEFDAAIEKCNIERCCGDCQKYYY